MCYILFRGQSALGTVDEILALQKWRRIYGSRASLFANNRRATRHGVMIIEKACGKMIQLVILVLH